MKKIIFIGTFIIMMNAHNASAQNLIPNTSFEVDTLCPTSTSEIYFARPWFQPINFVSHSTSASSTSDLFDTCGDSGVGGAGIPLNFVGYQYARTGKGYAGIYVSIDTISYREYLEVPLDSTLVGGQTYCISFYVSLADSSGEAISNFGAYFSVDSLLDSRYYALPIDSVTPQFENAYSNILSDTANWVEVHGSFVASGGEKFMTIGNFHKPANTHRISISPEWWNGAYYYIDDVSLVKCSGDGIEENENSNQISIYPNPSNAVFTASTTGSKIKQIKIVNVLGQEVNRQQATSNSASIDLTGFAKGVYFAEVQTEKGIMRKKIVKE